jgi:hypothetical protein
MEEEAMKGLMLAAVTMSILVLLGGCLYSHVAMPFDTNLDKTVLGQKQGRASMQSVLWLVAWGDASTNAAAKQGGITTINHMDTEVLNILFGLYTRTTFIVYGD